MSSTRVAVPVPSVRPPDVLGFPFGMLVLLGIGTTLSAVVYLAIVTIGLFAGEGSVQWQVFPFGIGMLGLGVGALLGAFALWRRRRRARMIALLVLPLFVAIGALDGLVVNDDWGLRFNPYLAVLLLLPTVAWAIFLLPSIRRYYKPLGT